MGFFISLLLNIHLGEEWLCSEKKANAAGYIKADTCSKSEKK